MGAGPAGVKSFCRSWLKRRLVQSTENAFFPIYRRLKYKIPATPPLTTEFVYQLRLCIRFANVLVILDLTRLIAFRSRLIEFRFLASKVMVAIVFTVSYPPNFQI